MFMKGVSISSAQFGGYAQQLGRRHLSAFAGKNVLKAYQIQNNNSQIKSLQRNLKRGISTTPVLRAFTQLQIEIHQKENYILNRKYSTHSYVADPNELPKDHYRHPYNHTKHYELNGVEVIGPVNLSTAQQAVHLQEMNEAWKLGCDSVMKAQENNQSATTHSTDSTNSYVADPNELPKDHYRHPYNHTKHYELNGVEVIGPVNLSTAQQAEHNALLREHGH